MFVVAQDYNRLPYNLQIETDQSTIFQDFVNYHEEERLRKLLGNLFYDSMVAGYHALPALWIAANGTGYSIGNQVVYVVDNKADIYTSIANTNLLLPSNVAGWTKQPFNRWARLVYGDTYEYTGYPQKWYGMNRLVKPLIYSLWTAYNYDTQLGTGVVVSLKENSKVISPMQRIVRGWNEFAKWAGDYDELENTFFGFLYYCEYFDSDVKPKYQDFKNYISYEFCKPEDMNTMGI